MVSVLNSRASTQGLCLSGDFVLCSWVRHLHSVSVHLGVQMGTGEFSSGGNPAMDQHPNQGGVEIFLVTSYYGNWDQLQPDEALCLYTDLTNLF